MSVGFCTLAIHAPYRRRARQLVTDAPQLAWTVLTDEPADFAGLPVTALRHSPTGPMAVDYLARLAPTGEGRGAAAYHDKRFALSATLQRFDTAIFLDADSRIRGKPVLRRYPPGLCALPVVRKTIADHLATCGSWRLPAFQTLARALTGGTEVLDHAPWCHETLIAVTRDGREGRFFEAWAHAAEQMQALQVFSGEGGVLGLAAHCAGWLVDFAALDPLDPFIQHEGGGPKSA